MELEIPTGSGPGEGLPGLKTETWARAAAVLLASVLWIAPLELWARWWTAKRGDPLDKAVAVLRMDAGLGWRQWEHWRGTFLDLPLRTDALGLRNPEGPAPAKGPRVVVLGPSSTFGWGVREEETYSRVLEGLLRGRGIPASVVNAGEIGYSTWQGLEFYRRHYLGSKPDLIVIAYGVNDVDRHRFFFSDPRPDSEGLAQERSKWMLGAQNLAARLRMFHVARRQGMLLLSRLACPLGAKAPERPVLGLRVSEAEFQSNFHQMLILARQEGTKVVFLTSPFLLPGFPPVAGTAQAAARLRHEEGLARYRAGDHAAAAALFEEALSLDPGRLESAYHLNASCLALRRCAQARKAFETARGLEPARLARDIRRYNEALRALARREGVPLVDAEKLLEGGDKALFVDPIHPTAEGHRRIAKALSEAILGGRLLGG